MWKFYLIDIILFLGASSSFLLIPLRNEFIYQRVAEIHNYTQAKGSYCGSNNTNQTNEDNILAKEVSKWTMLINLSIFVPAMVVGAFLTSWGDKVGRKITLAIPLVGMTVSSIFQALIIHLEWPLATMFGYGIIAGTSGYFMTLLIQGTAYLSDVTKVKDRAKRFTILETFIGVGGGLAGLGGGYWISAQGFLPSVWFTVALTGIGCCILPFLPDSLAYKASIKTTVKDRTFSSLNSDEDDAPQYMEIERETDSEETANLLIDDCADNTKTKYKFSDMWIAVWKVYTTEYMTCEKCFGPEPDIKKMKQDNQINRCNHGGGLMPGRIWRLWLYVSSYCLYMFLNVGIIVFQTIFFLASPLCFTPVLVGAQLSVKFISVIAGPILVFLFQRCGLSNQPIILISLVGFFAFPFIMSFAKEAWLVFVATSTMTVGCIAKPFIQAQVSSLASETEQGAAFALLSSSEVLSFLLATICYLTIYPATQYISHWFSWMFSAAVAIIPLVLMGFVYIMDKRRDRELKDDQHALLRE